MIELEDVRSAADRLAGVAHRTPIVTSATLDRLLGGQVFLKAENLQRVGAFKFRGAYNAIAQLTPEARSRGVVAFSSGNHAQAVALASSLLGTRATIVMPHDAPGSKVAATRGYGAEIVQYDRYSEDRAALAASLVEATGAALVPPYDHEPVMAGQGTVALEMLDEVADLDLMVVPIGGGGLISGCATVAAAHGVEVVGVEPQSRPAARRALEEKEVVTLPIARTIADGQQTPSIGERPYEVISRRVAGVVGVSDDAIIAAMVLLFERLKLVVEPSGASALAALLSGAVAPVTGRRVGVVLSGGNVDLDRFRALVGDR